MTDVTLNNESQKKYNPFVDPFFLTAFFFTGGTLLYMVAKAVASPLPFSIFLSSFITPFLTMIVWCGFVYIRKGKNGSFAIGFILAILVFFLSSFIQNRIEQKRFYNNFEKRMQDVSKKSREDILRDIQGY